MSEDVKEQVSLEENLKEVEKLIEVLSGDDISLEDAFKSYSKGMELLRICDEQIDKVEKEVLILSGAGE